MQILCEETEHYFLNFYEEEISRLRFAPLEMTKYAATLEMTRLAATLEIKESLLSYDRYGGMVIAICKKLRHVRNEDACLTMPEIIQMSSRAKSRDLLFLCCHSERSEESAFSKEEISRLRFRSARNDEASFYVRYAEVVLTLRQK